MGPQRSAPSRPITSEKDRQIRTIQTSLIHERLIATQRALDTLRITHAEELEVERRASEGLRKKLAVCEERVREAERERDDMREVVNELVDRVSVSKDFTAWPCSQLRVTSLLDPAELTPPAPPTTPPYAAALIESLSTSLATERKAHTRTTRVAQNTIAVLEAQLALREAELEESWPRRGHGEEEGMGIGEEEALRVLELNVRRQRRIEMDTRVLNARLETLRSPPPNPNPNPIEALNAQIQQLAAQVDSFRAERQRLRELIESEKLVSESAGSLLPPPREKPEVEVSLLEDEIPMDLATPLFPTTLHPHPHLHHDPLLPETNTAPPPGRAETAVPDLHAQLRDLHFS